MKDIVNGEVPVEPAERRFRRVAVLMGGPSDEREVSLRSGRAVQRGLQAAGYDAVAIDLPGRTLDLPAGIEAAFLALHGEFGEDGEIQTLLDRLGLPYTGAGAEASRMAFDKNAAKRAFVEAGVPTPTYASVSAGDRLPLPLPVVVKPARQGSSIGIRRVNREEEWTEALNAAARYAGGVLVESYISGRELTVGLVGDEALPVLEIVAPGGWYDFDAKYTPGACRYEAPAAIPEPTARRCRALAVNAARALGTRSLGRVDLRLAPDGALFVLELNSIPGFTETSLLPKAAAAAGLSFPVLCHRILTLARTG